MEKQQELRQLFTRLKLASDHFNHFEKLKDKDSQEKVIVACERKLIPQLEKLGVPRNMSLGLIVFGNLTDYWKRVGVKF